MIITSRLTSAAKWRLLAASLAAVVFIARTGEASTLYLNDYTAAGLPDATAQFVVDAGAGVLNYEDTAPAGVNLVATAAAQVAGLGDVDFVVSTTFTVNAVGTNTANSSTVGFGLFGSNAAFSGNAANPYYLADVVINGQLANLGQMRILALGDTSDFTASGNFAGPALMAGETYELRLTGSYSGGTLSMTLQMYDALGNPLGASGTATDASPLTGQYFGYRNRLVGNSATTAISYDEFSVVEVPEPSAIVLLLGWSAVGLARVAPVRTKTFGAR